MIEIKNLYKLFGEKREKARALLQNGHSKKQILEKTGCTVAINNVSLSIKKGETFVVMGLSGSGKSTLIRCLNRLINPTWGQILIDGQDITKLDHTGLQALRREKISMVFQSFALFPHKTVLENVAYGLKIKKLGKEERKEKAAEAIKLVGLQNYEDSYPRQLSGGMQQRVGLARALAADTEILLMDEAFSALDPLIRKEMQDELIQLQEVMNKTVIFITHDLDEALKLGDRIALMKDGEVVQVGTPEEILTSPATKYVERFVEGVDRSKVITAEMTMQKTKATIRCDKDGPRVALHTMQQNGISSVFAVDKKGQLKGLVYAEDALAAIDRKEDNLEAILRTDINSVLPDTLLKDLFALLAERSDPVAVVNEENKLLGVIVRGSVIAMLAQGGEVSNA